MIDLMPNFGPAVSGSPASSSLMTAVTFDFTTAAVVSFVLVLLGMAAGLLLMIRFTSRHVQKGGQ
jgi:hypothetical protein